jgi:hypothetical protein
METKGTPPTAGDVQQQGSGTMPQFTGILLGGAPVGTPQLGMDPSGNPYFTQDVDMGGRIFTTIATPPSASISPEKFQQIQDAMERYRTFLMTE